MIPVSLNPVWRKLIKDKIDEIRPDLIMPREIMLAEAASDIARAGNIPVIIDMAEHYPAAMKGWKKYSGNFIKRLFVHHLDIPELVERRSVQKSDGIITVCQEQNTRLNKEYGIPFENMAVVHNTPDLQWFDGVRKGPSNPPEVFAYHGYISGDRNLDVMIKAFIIAGKNNSDIAFTISGSFGEGYEELKSIASNSNVSDRIKFTGEYKHSQIKELYSEMDVGILPYKNNTFINHTLSNKLFDYLAVGKPVIVSEAAPMARVINETGAGIVADCSRPESLAEAILKIKDMPLDDISKKEMKASIEKYNWQVDSGNMVDFLNKYL
jgi:glycosyltransferase involved in cell wall biosynthesis